MIVERPPMRPKDQIAYNKARAKRRKNLWIFWSVTLLALALIFWKFTLATLIVAASSIFTASAPWTLPLFSYMFYKDRHRR